MTPGQQVMTPGQQVMKFKSSDYIILYQHIRYSDLL